MTTTTTLPPFDQKAAAMALAATLGLVLAVSVGMGAGNIVDVTIVALSVGFCAGTAWCIWQDKRRNLSPLTKVATFLTPSRHKENPSTDNGNGSNEKAAEHSEDVQGTKAPSTPPRGAGVQTIPLKTPSNNPKPASWAPPSSGTRHKMKASANEILTTPPPTTRSDIEAVSTRTRSKKRHATSDSAHGM